MSEPTSPASTPLGPHRQRLRWAAGVLSLGVGGLTGLVLPGCSSVPKSSPSGGVLGRGPAPGAMGRSGSLPPDGATTPLPGTAPVPGLAVEPTSREQQALATERQWLQAWFKDTPVRIAEEPGGLIVEVPIAFAFDKARSEPKPPLLAVLDKVSQSLLRQPQARLGLVAAPDDGNAVATTALATQRAAQVRRYLIGRGVAASRLGPPAGTSAAALQLRMEIAAP